MKKKSIPTFPDGQTIDLSVSNQQVFKNVPFAKKGVVADTPAAYATIKQNVTNLIVALKVNGMKKLYLTGYIPYRLAFFIAFIIRDFWHGATVYVGPKGEQYDYGCIAS